MEHKKEWTLSFMSLTKNSDMDDYELLLVFEALWT